MNFKGIKRPAENGDEGGRPLSKIPKYAAENKYGHNRRLDETCKPIRYNKGTSYKQNTATKKGEMLQFKSLNNKEEGSESNILIDKAVKTTDLEEYQALFDSDLSSVATMTISKSVKNTSHVYNHIRKHSSSKSGESSFVSKPKYKPHTFHKAYCNEPSKGDSTSRDVPPFLTSSSSTKHKNKNEKPLSSSRHESSSIKLKHKSTTWSDSKMTPQSVHTETKKHSTNIENKVKEHSKHSNTSDSKGRDKKEKKTSAGRIVDLNFDFINAVDPELSNRHSEITQKPAENDTNVRKTKSLSKTNKEHVDRQTKGETHTQSIRPSTSNIQSRGRQAGENHKTIVDSRKQKNQKRVTQTEVKRRTIVGPREKILAKPFGHEIGVLVIDQSETQVNEAELVATDADNEAISNAVPKPSISRVKGLKKTTATIIVMDLETTGLIQKDSDVCNMSKLARLTDLGLEHCSKDRLYQVATSLQVHPRIARIISVEKYLIPHITQIAALEINSKKTFSRYVIPKLPINSVAEKLTGIKYDGKIFKVCGKPVFDALTIDKAICEFMDWLKQFENVVLVAHNGKRFDFRILSFAVEMTKNRTQFLNSVTAFADSLCIFKECYPDLKKRSQEFLAKYILEEEYNAHNAIDDVAMLDKILTKADICKCAYVSHSYDAEYHFLQEQFERCKLQNFPDLQILVRSEVMTKCMAEKVAGSGLNLRHLKLIFQKQGAIGLHREFSRLNCRGKPRVTSMENKLSVIIPKLCALFSKNRTELSIITNP